MEKLHPSKKAFVPKKVLSVIGRKTMVQQYH